MADTLIIFDTTLRDGEQSPGASMTRDEKIQIARQLERLKVDVIEAGFAASSQGEFETLQALATLIKDSKLCSLARANEKDIERVAQALKAAEQFRIHIFLATSALHMAKKLQMSPEQVLERARTAVRFARGFSDDIEFSPEDSSRSDPDFLCRVIEAVIDEGATTINIPDTVGYAIPESFGLMIKNLRERIPNAHKAVWSVHCHNDLGLGVANSLAGVHIGGARQIECTINGLGERAGNTSLEEVVMAVRTRKDYFGLDTRIDATQLVSASKLVSQTTGFIVQPNKAIVGANAFAHASGIHQDGILKARDTYEIMRAQDVGWSANKMVLGKLSGRGALKQRLQELGVQLPADDNGETLNQIFIRFKTLADGKADIYDEDILAIATDAARTAEQEDAYQFVSLEQRSKTGEQPWAEIVFTTPAIKKGSGEEVNGQASNQTTSQTVRSEAVGNGPVDATFKAIEATLESAVELMLYSVNAITTGTQAQGEVTVRLASAGRMVNGVGTDPDIVVASAKAYLAALNKLYIQPDKLNPQQG